MSIYQELILDHYHNPKNFGRLKNPSQTISVHNPLCGDTIEMQIKEKSGVVEEIAYSGEGCAISQASASMLTEYAKGKDIYELKKLTPEFIISMLGIELSPNRLKCALLSLEALKKVMSQELKVTS
jgi:nitrogen fixation NifU-like protein